MCSCLLCAPYWEPGPQPRHVPCLGVEPVHPLTGPRSIHWATSVRADLVFYTDLWDELIYIRLLVAYKWLHIQMKQPLLFWKVLRYIMNLDTFELIKNINGKNRKLLDQSPKWCYRQQFLNLFPLTRDFFRGLGGCRWRKGKRKSTGLYLWCVISSYTLPYFPCLLSYINSSPWKV